jgi:adenosine deaminase
MIEVARDFDLDVPYQEADKFRSLVQVREGEPLTHENFLGKFKTIRKFFLNKDIIQRITRETIADAADDNIRYMELRFTPFALTQLNKAPLGDAMDWVIEAAEDAAQEFDIPTKLIASVNRHEPVELAAEVAKLAANRIGQGIVAVDMAGAEASHAGEEFASVFQEAKQAGLHVTIHGGEWGGPERVRLAIEQLSAERIGHGVRVLEDPEVVKLAAEKKVTFEVCPTSNYQSGVCPSIYEHPLPKMIEAGLDTTLNTDDPGISQIDLSDEVELASETLGLDMKDIEKMILAAAQAAFLPEDEKKKLVTDLEEEFIEKNGNGS